MVFGREGCGEMVTQQIIADKKRIETYEVATHKAIPEFSSEYFICLQAGAIVLTAVTYPGGVIPDFPIHIGRQCSIVFNDNNPGMKGKKALPYVVRVLVDIEG